MSESKTILLVSYYWPPAGGISVLRTLKIAKFLSKLGWKTVVLTVDNPQYPIIDQNNLKDVPSNCTILKAKAFQPFNLYKKLTGRSKNDTLANVTNANEQNTGVIHKFSVWLRANFFIPDARVFWKNNAIEVASEYLKNNKIDAIFSDGPPHTNTLIACKLSKKFNLPWLMDWQDPWTEVDYYTQFPIGKRANKIHHKLEKECIEQCSQMTIVSPTWKKDVEKLGAKNTTLVYWGYDSEDFTSIKKTPNNKFTISHLGLLGDDRIPENVLKAVQELIQENDEFKNDINITFVGTVTNKVQLIINELDINNYCSIHKQIPRKEALELILNSAINLLLLNIAPNAKGRVPGKLFEYLYARNVILNLGPVDCDVEVILSDTELGKTFNYSDKEGIKSFILSKYQNWIKNKNLHSSISDDKIEVYSMKHQFETIDRLLNQMIQNTKS